MPSISAIAATATPLGTENVKMFSVRNNGSVVVFLHQDKSGTTPSAATVVGQGHPVLVGETYTRSDPDGIPLSWWFVATALTLCDVRMQ